MEKTVYADANPCCPVVLCDDPEKVRKFLENGMAAVGVCLTEERLSEYGGIPYLSMDWEPEGKWLSRVYCRLRGLPFTVAETEHLILREAVEDDAEELLLLYEEEEFQKYLEPLRPNVQEEQVAIRAYGERVYAFYGYGMWVVILKETGRLIGRVGLECNAGHDGLELGYAIRKDCRRKGYAEEACRAVLSYAEQELEETEIYVRIHPDNLSSMNLAEKLGVKIYTIEDRR